MADFRLLFPTDYVAAHDLGERDIRLKIRAVVVEKLQMTGGRKETKPVVIFHGAKKKLVLNKTNARLIAAQHGNDTDKWIGQVVTLYATTTDFGGKTVDCIRVREGQARVRGRAVPAESPPQLPPDEDPFLIDHGSVDDQTIPPADDMDPEPLLPPHDPVTGETRPS